MAEWVDTAKQRADLLAAQVEYGEQIQAWLKRGFPELCSPSPHPAAVAAVIRLHGRHGKGQLTMREHGPAIHAAVARWQEVWGDDGQPEELHAELEPRGFE